MEYAVIVSLGSFGDSETCRVRDEDQGCGNKPILAVCLCGVSDGGQTSSSSLSSQCCGHHLSHAIREAYAEVRVKEKQGAGAR